MMRLIDVDALRERHCSDCSADVQGLCATDPICASLMWVKEAPTIDAVPVVRCKECTHYTAYIGWCDIHSCFIDSNGTPCSPAESSDWKMFDEDYFCKDGERKDGGE